MTVTAITVRGISRCKIYVKCSFGDEGSVVVKHARAKKPLVGTPDDPHGLCIEFQQPEVIFDKQVIEMRRAGTERGRAKMQRAAFSPEFDGPEDDRHSFLGWTCGHGFEMGMTK